MNRYIIIELEIDRDTGVTTVAALASTRYKEPAYELARRREQWIAKHDSPELRKVAVYDSLVFGTEYKKFKDRVVYYESLTQKVDT